MNKTYIQERLTGNYGQVLTFNNSNELVVSEVYPSEVTYAAHIYISAPLGASIKVEDDENHVYDLSSLYFENTSELFVPSDNDSYISLDNNTMYVQEKAVYKFNVPHLGQWYVYIDNYKSYSSQGVYVNGTGDYYVTVSYFSCKINVTYTPGCSCECSNGDINLIANDDSGSWTFNVTSPGKWNIIIYKTLSDGRTMSSSKLIDVLNSDTSISVSLSVISEKLNDNSWETIQYASKEGIAESYWRLGDRKAVVLDGDVGTTYNSTYYSAKTFSNNTYWVCIIGFNHNYELEGSGITFQFAYETENSTAGIAFAAPDHYGQATSIVRAFLMNYNPNNSNNPTNYGGWTGSVMRNEILGTTIPSVSEISTTHNFLSVLPRDLLNVIKPIYKYTKNTTGDSSVSGHISSSYDYIFLPSVLETLGTVIDTNLSLYSSQYEYYSLNRWNAFRNIDITSTYNTYYWTRDPGTQSDDYYAIASYASTLSATDHASSVASLAIAPAFVVG